MRLIEKLSILCFLASSATYGRAADIDWNPARTRVFIVGLLEWKDSVTFGSFPKKGRRDTRLVSVFKKSGVPAQNISVMQDDAATTSFVRKAFDTFVGTVEKDETLFVYYCGHGYECEDGTVCFATYDAEGSKAKNGWAVPDIIKSIENNFEGVRVVLMADCCLSGAMVNAAKSARNKVQYACFASVENKETSTGCWTFSDSLLNALEGAPFVDVNGDGAITQDETAKYIHAEMAFFDDQTAASCVTNGFKPTFRLAAPERKSAHTRLGENVEAKQNGQWQKALIEDFKDGEFKVYFSSTADRQEIWVPERNIRSLKAPRTPGENPPAILSAGMAVKVEWKRRWWPAKILKENEKTLRYLVEYDGYDEEWNEWVAPTRIRLR